MNKHKVSIASKRYATIRLDIGPEKVHIKEEFMRFHKLQLKVISDTKVKNELIHSAMIDLEEFTYKDLGQYIYEFVESHSDFGRIELVGVK